MVRIRLRRMGAHKKPFYRVIVADQRSPRDGRFIEELGYYDPMTEPAKVPQKDVSVQAELLSQLSRSFRSVVRSEYLCDRISRYNLEG